MRQTKNKENKNHQMYHLLSKNKKITRKLETVYQQISYKYIVLIISITKE